MNAKLILAATALAILTPGPARALEVTAGGSLEVQASWSALKSLIDSNRNAIVINTTDIKSLKDEVNAQIACAKQGQLWNGSGCAAIPTASHIAETGQFVADSEDTNYRSYHINFNRPFAHVPDVTTAIRKMVSMNSCVNDRRNMDTWAYNVTQYGFDVALSGMQNCAGFTTLTGITWVAVDEQQ